MSTVSNTSDIIEANPRTVFVIGDIVQLSPNRRQHSAGRSNPYPNTEWFCEGRITNINPRERQCPIRVEWNNKTTNVYDKSDLIIIKKNEMKKHEYSTIYSRDIEKTTEAIQLQNFIIDEYFDNADIAETQLNITQLTILNPLYVWRTLFGTFTDFEYSFISPDILDICKPNYQLKHDNNIENITLIKTSEENGEGDNETFIERIDSNTKITLQFQTLPLNEPVLLKLLKWQNQELNKIIELSNYENESPIKVQMQTREASEKFAIIEINPFFIHVPNY